MMKNIHFKMIFYFEQVIIKSWCWIWFFQLDFTWLEIVKEIFFKLADIDFIFMRLFQK